MLRQADRTMPLLYTHLIPATFGGQPVPRALKPLFFSTAELLPKEQFSAWEAYAACIADVSSVSGKAANAYALLRAAVDAAPDADAGLREWSLSVLAEVAARAGDSVAAERYYRAAMECAPRDAAVRQPSERI